MIGTTANETMMTADTKPEWRERIVASRRARGPVDRAAARARISQHAVDALVALGPAPTVCVYLPLSTEPLAPELPAVLRAAGARVLAPVARRGAPLDWCELAGEPVAESGGEASGDTGDGSDGEAGGGSGGEAGGGPRPAATPRASGAAAGTDPGLRRGMLGVLEPTGPRLGPSIVRTVDAVLVPALAVDVAGTRLGRGGGHYDRTLALIGERRATTPAGPRPLLIAVVFDDEFLRGPLPREPHDRPVDAIITPSGGLHTFPPTSAHG